MTIHARCCWIWMFVFVCVWERVWGAWHPLVWCLPSHSHTHTLTMSYSSLDSVPYLPRGTTVVPLQLTSTSLNQEWQVRTQTYSALALTGRYPVVSCISAASSGGSSSWKRNVCWSQRGNLCMTNLWPQFAGLYGAKTTTDIWGELDHIYLFINSAPGQPADRRVLGVMCVWQRVCMCLVTNVSFPFHRYCQPPRYSQVFQETSTGHWKISCRISCVQRITGLPDKSICTL